MKYEAPELTLLPSAISAIQATKPFGSPEDPDFDENMSTYEDWEE